MALWVIFPGIFGARLFHVLDHWSHEYAANPIRSLYFWEGGLAIWGAVVARRPRRRFFKVDFSRDEVLEFLLRQELCKQVTMIARGATPT